MTEEEHVAEEGHVAETPVLTDWKQRKGSVEVLLFFFLIAVFYLHF